MAVNEEVVSQWEQLFGELITEAGKAEQTRIVPNLEVIDAAPAAPLTNYVIVTGGPGGTFRGPALKLPGYTYTNGDTVNVLFVEGTEPIAMQQGAGSPSSNTGRVSALWESDFGAIAWQTEADGDLTNPTSADMLLTAAAAPQSQAENGILQRLGYLLDGGHPLNAYPTSRNSDDAEFNNSTIADNNTVGTIAGGAFWEWTTGNPASGSGQYNINTTRRSHFRASINRLDSDAELQGDISAIPDATNTTFTVCLRFILPFGATSDEYFGIRLLDASSSNYYETVWRNDGSGSMQCYGAYVDGGARTQDGAAVTFADAPGPEALWLRWRQQNNDRYRAQFSLDGFNFFNIESAAKLFSNTYDPDELYLIFGKPDTASISTIDYYLDSFRRE